jgi:signal transduction histidine kinase
MNMGNEQRTDRIAPDTAPDSGKALVVLFHDRLLGTRLYIHSVARFLIVAAIILGTVFAQRVVGITDLPTIPFIVLAVMLGLYNVPIFITARRYRGLEQGIPPHRLLAGLMHTTIFMDFIFLTILLWLVGGANSPFKAFYLIHVILASLLLSPRSACAHALLGYVMFTALVVAQWFEWLPHYAPVGAVNSDAALDGRYVVTVLVVQAILMAFATFLISGLTRMLRTGEERLGSANAQLTRLSKMRRAFLHVTLHDLKSPADAMTMLLNNLSSGIGGELTDQQQHWVERCQTRLAELSAFLRDFQILAALDSDAIDNHADTIDVARMLDEVLVENEDLIRRSMHEVTLDADQGLVVRGIERLVHEAVANLVTNAIKYTPLGGCIDIRARKDDTVLRIEVKDNGIGISPEDQKKLFQEFVRLKPRYDQTGDVPGSGLGLSIVQRIVEMHQGRVRVVSEPNRGSTFIIEIPAAPEGSA